MSALPDEPARLREDATLALPDVHSAELHRAGGVEEAAVMRFQDDEAGPPQCRVEACMWWPGTGWGGDGDLPGWVP